MNKRLHGLNIEAWTAEQLVNLGWELVERNYNSPVGEIDIIAYDPKRELVFVEVRSAQEMSPVDVSELLPARKLSHLKRTVEHWFLTHPQLRAMPWRVDFVGVVMADAPVRYEHYRGI